MALIGAFLRLGFFAVLAWFALAALWLGLSSPTREYAHEPGRYALSTLRSGRPLLRVYDTAAYNREDGYKVDFRRNGDSRRSFALSFRLEPQRNTTLLTLMDGLTIDLSPEYITSYPFVSQEKYTVTWTGDQDGINPPWFTTADSTLLFWWIHRDEGKVRLRVRWRDANTVEIWPADARQEDMVDDVESMGQQQPMLLLRFQAPPKNQGNQVALLQEVVLPQQSSSPSGTYAIRVCILAVIAPTGLLAMGIITAISPTIAFMFALVVLFAKMLGFYCAFVALIWVIRGRRPIAEDNIVSRFPGMEFFGGQGSRRRSGRSGGRRTVWGPSGPIEIDYDDIAGTQRTPIRSIADFFRSSDPLDDLLASFDSTRHLTEPLGWGRRRPEAQRGASPASTGMEGKSSRHRKTYSDDDELDESGLIDLEKALPTKPGIVLNLEEEKQSGRDR